MEFNQRLLKINLAVKWLQGTLSLFLILVCALCFLKYLGWAWVVSGGMGGDPTQAEYIRQARQWGIDWLYASLLGEGILVINLTTQLKIDITDLTGIPKTIIRIAVAIIIAIVGTLSTMFLLNSIGKLHH